MPRLSGWCLVRGRPDCARCRVVECECPGCAKPAQARGLQRQIEDVACENGGTSKDAPAGALTPVAPGLTAVRSG